MANTAHEIDYTDSELDALLDSIGDKYEKPSTGIPKTDLASAVQTSLGKADTALQSYTETDPVFAASAAHGITSSDISNWNSKTSNIGTITGINMNGASKGTSGVVDLGTVITAHQDISGKADKATTLAGYGITDAYTNTEDYSRFYALYGGTQLNPSSTNTVNLNSLTDTGSYWSTAANIQYVTNRPVDRAAAFRIWVSAPAGESSTYRRQRFQYYDQAEIYERPTFTGGSSWSNWVLVQGDLSSYASASDVTTLQGYFDANGNANTANQLTTPKTLWGQSFNGSANVSGNLSSVGNISMTGNISLENNKYINFKDSNGTARTIIYLSSSNNCNVGIGAVQAGGDSVLYGKNIRFYAGGISESYTAMFITNSKSVGIGTTAPSTLLHVNGVITCTSVVQTSDERKKNKVDDIAINIEDIANAPNVTFKWKEGKDTENIHGGSTAQYWEKITPYYVHGEETKTLEYGNLALSCAIELAKEVVQLKKENAQLKKELAEIKGMISKLYK